MEYNELKFKQGSYKCYAPWLYKFHRLLAKFDLYRWGFSPRELDQLAQHYWDLFLGDKFEQELKGRKLEVFDVNCSGAAAAYNNAFILGSGPSINYISESHWDCISRDFSVGLNNFYIHDFTPNVYFCEFANNPEFLELIYSRLLDNPSRKLSQVYLAGWYILLRGQGYKLPAVQRPKFYVSRSIRLTHKTLLTKLIRRYYEQESGFLIHHISNLDTVIHYCVKQGFKNIYLVGVDLKDDGYFWDHIDTPIYRQGRIFIRSFQKQVLYQKDNSGRHATASSEVAERLGKITIVDYLELLQTKILSPKGVQLWVCNSNSLLADVLPVKELSELIST